MARALLIKITTRSNYSERFCILS